MNDLGYVDYFAVAMVALIAFSFWRLNRDPTVNFNIIDLLMFEGRISRMACVFIASFGVCSWIMVKLALDGKMTEGYLTSYGAIFVAPLVLRLFSPPLTPGTTTTTTAQITEVVTPPPKVKK